MPKLTEFVYDPPPIQGYNSLTQPAIDLINIVQCSEQMVMTLLRDLADDADVDPRWLAIGRTDIEKGFMAVRRSIACPNGT
jgi:hypothetical protein